MDIRSKELDNTAVPLPFEIFATLKTVKYDIVEKKIHKAIDRLTDLRIRQNREFFNIKPELALEILRDEAMVLDDAEVTLYKDNKPIKPVDPNKPIDPIPPVPHRPRFKFSMVNIPIGSTLTFIPTGVKVKVASEDQIEYTSCHLSLAHLCRRIKETLPEHIKGRNSLLSKERFLTISESVWNKQP